MPASSSSSSSSRANNGRNNDDPTDPNSDTDPLDGGEKPDEDYYTTLDISSDATAEDIKTAFRNLSRLHHPDKAPLGQSEKDKQNSFERFLKVDKAYRVLSNETLRAFYDKYGMASMPTAERVPRKSYERGE